MIWGLYFGLWLVVEKIWLKEKLDSSPNFIKHFYVLFVVLISFVIFNSSSLASIGTYLKGMFGLLNIPVVNKESLYYLRSYSTLLFVSVIGATPLLKQLYQSLTELSSVNKILSVAQPIFYILLLLMSTGYLVDASFNPFLYFRF